MENMREWLENVRKSKVKKAMPILAFPCVQLLGVTVGELVSDARTQARGLKAVAEQVDALAAVSFMDLSLEAEAFGAAVKLSETEVPTVVGTLVNNVDQAEALELPSLESGRIPVYLEGVSRALDLIGDRPLLAGVIGPFSLAGRLLDVNRSMLYCKKDPELLHTVLRKTTEFIIAYGKAYKKIGAGGVLMAEPLTGMLSPRLAETFSEPYVREIAAALRAEDFLVIYHNCGNATLKMADSILRTGCDAYHFGNAIQMAAMLELFPEERVVMGNIDPAGQFTKGSPASMAAATRELLEQCGSRPNFVLSSGCDIPPTASWENIRAFFAAAREFYGQE